MSENSDIPPDAVVFRSIRNGPWIEAESKEPQYTAFLLRPSDKGKLSILTEANCQEGFCANLFFNKCFGEIILRAEAFTKLGLKVIDDSAEVFPGHASVLGLPEYDPEDETSENSIEARRLADEILKSVVNVQSRRFKKTN